MTAMGCKAVVKTHDVHRAGSRFLPLYASRRTLLHSCAVRNDEVRPIGILQLAFIEETDSGSGNAPAH